MYLGLSTWSKTLFQKLAVSHLLKKILHILWNQNHNFFPH